MIIAVFIILGIYFIEHAVMLIGIIINSRKPSNNFPGKLPIVSIIVAARNEEDNIGLCIESLLKIDYPGDKLEIILMNDRSTDRTKEIIFSYMEKNPVIKYLEANESIGKLKGKTNALAIAIKKSKGEMIFTTDADIQVRPAWVMEMIKYYDGVTGVVSSFSTIAPKNLWWGMQSFDWLYLLAIACGGNGVNQEISCLGNNMSYRRKAYEEVGGYENIKFSVTEDFMLLHTIREKTKWKAKFPVNIDVMNDTYPCKDVMELYRQKKRWMRGGLDSGYPGVTAGIIEYITNSVFLFGWIFVDIKHYLIYVFSKILIDILFVFIPAKKFKMLKVYIYLLFFEIYFSIYTFLTPFIVIFGGKVVWKEQKL
jgi:cellulose synthase/poly-beta-1,6-N-acetylglucosamine synthase-like glycosyltransferase